MMALSLEQAKKCQVDGHISWPDYFNSKTYLQGAINNDTLLIREEALVQGIEMDLQSTYQAVLIEEGEIQGKVYDSSNVWIASFTLTGIDKMDKETLQSWQDKQQQQVEKFGTAKILEENLQIEISEIIQKRAPEANQPSFSTVEITADAKVGQMQLPMYIAIKQPNYIYLETSFQNLKLIRSSYDSITWSYDPMKDKVTIQKNEEEVDFGQFSSFAGADINHLIDSSEFIVSEIRNSLLNGEECYRILLTNRDEKQIIFIDKKTGHSVRKDKNTEIEYYLSYRNYSGFDFPSTVIQVDLKSRNEFSIQEVSINIPLDDSLFFIPAHLKSKVEAEVKDGDYYNELGNEEFKNSEFDLALQHYSKAIAQNPNNGIYYYNRGVVKLETEDYYGAISDFNQSISLKPNYSATYNRLGVAKFKLGDYTSAITDFDKAIGLDSTFEKAYYNRGYTYLTLNEYEDAMRDYQYLTTIDSTNGDYFFHVGFTLAQTGEHTEAIRYYEQGKTLGYETANTHNYLGVSYYAVEDYQKALVAFKEASRLDTLDATKTLNLGKAYYELERYDSAEIFINKALSVSSDNDDAISYLGLVYYQQEDYNQAIHYFTEAIKIMDQNAYYFDYRARAKREAMDFEGAVEDFTASIDLYSKDPVTFYERGMVKMLMNNQYDACRDFQKAMDLGLQEAEEKIEETCLFNGD
ncbi:tetratricopeptide repeat protein [Tunicatimonas pelagia]|uniref:tetratricopeptide repeat protein n=1 Tax=Tunicatimonas pelagia TaxID=931531 RepID=UPI0026665DB7|nr:tetratricopeptide repeat protein [Tunicatimonas pelagia]WKN40662.1 tetratricopeptide repeat protein [Tunicatimonas pelagia]